MEITKRYPSDLTQDENNARSHDEIGVDVLLKSLQTFGQQKPVVIDKENKIIAGHATVRASIKLGMDEVDCVVTELEEQDKIAYGIADNRCADLASWNDAVLKDIGRSLPEDLLMATGFNRIDWERMTKESGLELDIDIEDDENQEGGKEENEIPENYVRQIVLRCTKKQFNEMNKLIKEASVLAKSNSKEDTIMYALREGNK